MPYRRYPKQCLHQRTWSTCARCVFLGVDDVYDVYVCTDVRHTEGFVLFWVSLGPTRTEANYTLPRPNWETVAPHEVTFGLQLLAKTRLPSNYGWTVPQEYGGPAPVRFP